MYSLNNQYCIETPILVNYITNRITWQFFREAVYVNFFNEKQNVVTNSVVQETNSILDLVYIGLLKSYKLVKTGWIWLHAKFKMNIGKFVELLK